VHSFSGTYHRLSLSQTTFLDGSPRSARAIRQHEQQVQALSATLSKVVQQQCQLEGDLEALEHRHDEDEDEETLQAALHAEQEAFERCTSELDRLHQEETSRKSALQIAQQSMAKADINRR